MVKVFKKSRFRIYIYDTKTNAARSVSLMDDSDSITIDEVKQQIIDCFSEEK